MRPMPSQSESSQTEGRLILELCCSLHFKWACVTPKSDLAIRGMQLNFQLSWVCSPCWLLICQFDLLSIFFSCLSLIQVFFLKPLVSQKNMKMRPDQERVRNLLLDTVTLLCKNGLDYKREMKVQGLIGITIDDEDVFLVHFDELSELPSDETEPKKKKRGSDVIDLDLGPGPQAKQQKLSMEDGAVMSPLSKRLDLSSTLRQHHPETKPKIKEEKLDDVVVLDDQVDSKPNVNIAGDIEMDSNQLAALTGYSQGSSSVSGAGGGGRGGLPPGPPGWMPGQPGPSPDMVGTLSSCKCFSECHAVELCHQFE